VVQHLPDAPEPGPPLTARCRLCPQRFRDKTRLAEHITRTHGGEDRYRERWIYEAKRPRPEGMHSGETEFEPCGRADCAECKDPSTCELCGSGTVPKNLADRVFYERERARYGYVLSPEARMKRQQVPSAANWRQNGLESLPHPQRTEDIRQIKILGIFGISVGRTPQVRLLDFIPLVILLGRVRI